MASNNNDKTIEERVSALEDEIRKSKRDRKRIKNALEQLLLQEKSARGQYDFGAILKILSDDNGGDDEKKQ